jgi:hypothetical protein
MVFGGKAIFHVPSDFRVMVGFVLPAPLSGVSRSKRFLSPKTRLWYSLQSELQKRTSAESGDNEEPIAISMKLRTVGVSGFEIATSFP